MRVLVRDNNVEQAIRALKRKMQREGILREIKARRAYEKPSERRAREKGEAVRRSRKAARKLAIREGLIAGLEGRVIVGRTQQYLRPVGQILPENADFQIVRPIGRRQRQIVARRNMPVLWQALVELRIDAVAERPA